MDYSTVTDTIRFFVEFDGVFEVNDDDLVVRKGKSDDFVEIDIEKNGKLARSRLVLYKENIPGDIDATILNPFSEGMRKNEAVSWLYKTTAATFDYKVNSYMHQVLTLAVAAQKEDLSGIDKDFLNIISKYTKKADDKMIKEFEMIMEQPLTLFDTNYSMRDQKSRVICHMFKGPGFKDQFKDIRKKSWPVFSEIYCDLFDIDKTIKDEKKMDKFTTGMKAVKIPKITAIMNMWGNLYETVHDKFTLLDEFNEENDKQNLQFHIDIEKFIAYTDTDHLKECHRVAKDILGSYVGQDNVADKSDQFVGANKFDRSFPQNKSNPFERGGTIGGNKFSRQKRTPFDRDNTNPFDRTPFAEETVTLYNTKSFSTKTGFGGPVETLGTIPVSQSVVFK